MTPNNKVVLETHPCQGRGKIDMEVKFEYETDAINLWISGTSHWAPSESPFTNNLGSRYRISSLEKITKVTWHVNQLLFECILCYSHIHLTTKSNYDWAPALGRIMKIWDTWDPDTILKKLSIVGWREGELGSTMGKEVQDGVAQTTLGGGGGQEKFCRRGDAWTGSRRERKILLVTTEILFRQNRVCWKDIGSLPLLGKGRDAMEYHGFKCSPGPCDVLTLVFLHISFILSYQTPAWHLAAEDSSPHTAQLCHQRWTDPISSYPVWKLLRTGSGPTTELVSYGQRTVPSYNTHGLWRTNSVHWARSQKENGKPWEPNNHFSWDPS